MDEAAEEEGEEFVPGVSEELHIPKECNLVTVC